MVAVVLGGSSGRIGDLYSLSTRSPEGDGREGSENPSLGLVPAERTHGSLFGGWRGYCLPLEDSLLDTPRRRDGLHVRDVDGETVILDLENQRMHNLNVTAAFIFDGIDGRRTEKEISEELASAFEIPIDVAERDTRALLVQFRELGLLA